MPLSFLGKPVSECPSGQLRALTVSKAPPTVPVTLHSPADADLSDAKHRTWAEQFGGKGAPF